jgi:glucose-1-phosphate thymidylyltransferase
VILVTPPASSSSLVGGAATALQPVANRPIVWHVLDALREAGVRDVSVVVPASLASDVRACIALRPRDVRIRYAVHDQANDSSDALRSAVAAVGDAPCVLHLADGLLAEPLGPLLRRLESSSTDLLVLVHPGAREDRRLASETRRLLRIAEFDPARSALGMAGVCLFGRGALRQASHWLSGSELDLGTAVEQLASAGGRLDVQLARGWLRYGGDSVDLLELNRATLDALPAGGEPPLDGDNQIEGRVAIDATAKVTSSVIVGPSIIGPGARVTHAYIGPYTSIGAGVEIEGAEIERSIISSGASIRHLGGRLVASVVGANARIFRDFSLPRATRLRVGDDTEVALS